MKIIATNLLIVFMNIIACKSFGQNSGQDKNKIDTSQIVSAKTVDIPDRIYNDLPKMPVKRERGNKLLLENKRGVKKADVNRRYKHERRIESRYIKKIDKKHGIIAERKKKDRMFK